MRQFYLFRAKIRLVETNKEFFQHIFLGIRQDSRYQIKSFKIDYFHKI